MAAAGRATLAERRDDERTMKRFSSCSFSVSQSASRSQWISGRQHFSPRKQTDYGAKVVTCWGVRYIVCVNHEEAEKDNAERDAILKSLKGELKKNASRRVTTERIALP